ncbi:MAG: LptF/LptG family permease [Elusimicrobia bacterium]|nr:LptF/LptG family permease [Elusimicrobiota bacterium]
MSKITRYFLKAFLHPLFFSFGALCVLVLVSELLEHLDRFLAAKASLAIVGQYVLSLLPIRSVEILPVAALLAVLFSLGNLSRHREITAAMLGGIHPWKCVQPILLCGVALSLFCLLLSEWVVPFTSHRAKELWDLEIRRLTTRRQTRYDQLTVAGENIFLTMGLLDTEHQWMENVVLDRLEDGRPVSQIQAHRAEWREGAWHFMDGVKRSFGADGLTLTNQEPFSEETVALKERPEDLVPQDPEPEEMSYKSFNRYLRRLRALGVPTRKQEVELHLKLALPWANLIVMLLGIPFAFQKTGGKVKAVGFALGVAFFYFGLMQVGRAIGQKPWFSPLMGAWLANMIFLSLGGWLFYRMRKLA